MNTKNETLKKSSDALPSPSEILAILSRTTESIPSCCDGDAESLHSRFKELDACVRFEDGILDTMAEVVYQDAPAVGQKLNKLLDSIEQICLYPELNARPAYLIAAKNIGTLFEGFAFLFKKKLPAELGKYNTTAFLIVDAPETELELVNFTNSRITGLDFKYYGALIDGCHANNIAVNQMVKMFVLHTPLTIPGGCLIFDGISGPMKNRMDRFVIDSSCLVKNEAELEQALKRNFDHVIAPGDLQSAQEKRIIGAEDFRRSFPFVEKIPVYGFYDEFLAEKCHVMVHYYGEIAKRSNMAIALRNDRVILEQDDLLSELERQENSLRQKLESDVKKLSECFDRAEKHLEDIRDLLHDVMSAKRFVPYRIANRLIAMFFEAVEAVDALAGTLSGRWRSNRNQYLQSLSAFADAAIARMRALKLEQLPMLDEFYNIKRSDCEPAATGDASSAIPKIAGNWVEAKILLSLTRFPRAVDEPSPNLLNRLRALLKFIGRHLLSGNEYYADYLVNQDIRSLWKALELGNRKAGEKLFELCRDHGPGLKKLAAHLVPEACFTLGQREADRYLQEFDDSECATFAFADKAFFYLKIAASLRYPPALEYLAELFYKRFFASCDILEEDTQVSEEKKHFGILTMAICSETEKWDIYGITAFCLGQFSVARKALLHINTPEAKYCRGYICWKGLGTANKNLREALKLMKEAAPDFPKAKDAQRRIQNAINASNVHRTNSYDSKNNYQDTSYTTRCSSSCIVLAALGLACNSSPIRQMHAFVGRTFGNTDGGRALVREYYRTGGLVMRRLENDPEAKSEYAQIRKKFLDETFSLVHRRKYGRAAETMIRLQAELCEKYGIPVDEKVLNILREHNRFAAMIEDIDLRS